MKTRFTDEQIIQMIKEQEAGERTADVCRRCGISQGTFYNYKSEYGGMEPSIATGLAVNGRERRSRHCARALTRPRMRERTDIRDRLPNACHDFTVEFGVGDRVEDARKNRAISFLGLRNRKHHRMRRGSETPRLKPDLSFQRVGAGYNNSNCRERNKQFRTVGMKG